MSPQIEQLQAEVARLLEENKLLREKRDDALEDLDAARDERDDAIDDRDDAIDNRNDAMYDRNDAIEDRHDAEQDLRAVERKYDHIKGERNASRADKKYYREEYLEAEQLMQLKMSADAVVKAAEAAYEAGEMPQGLHVAVKALGKVMYGSW